MKLFKKKEEWSGDRYYLMSLDRIWGGPYKNPEDAVECSIDGHVVKIEVVGKTESSMHYIPIEETDV